MLETQSAVEVFDRIVCGVDGTPESLEAVRQAGRLGAPEGLLRLTSVADLNIATHAGWAMSRVLEELDANARTALHRAIDEVHATSTQLRAGDVVPSLIDEIEGAEATLVALGPRGHSRAAGMLVGGVASQLLHDAPCSVLFARKPRFGPFPLNILTGVDGSPQSLAAAVVAQAVAERFGSEHVVVVATGGKNVEVDLVKELFPDAVVDPGRPVQALADLSNEVDLLVIGSRGLHGPRALGSVSERAAHQAACSVLVVRKVGRQS